MKQVFILQALMLSLCFWSCSDETEAPTPASQTTNQQTVAFTLPNSGQAYGKALCIDQEDNFYYTSKVFLCRVYSKYNQ